MMAQILPVRTHHSPTDFGPPQLVRWHPCAVTDQSPKNQHALEEALRRAEAALAADDGGSDVARTEVGDRARAEAKEVMEQLPKDSPARITRAFAHLLDNLVRVPGTNFRFGVDPLLSFFPGAGTAVGAAFGAVVLVDSVRLRTPVPVVARMLANYLIDWVIGIIPILGGFFDMAYRSNAKNLKLLNRTIENRDQVRKASVTYWLCVAVMATVVLAVVVGTPIALLLWLDGLITGG